MARLDNCGHDCGCVHEELCVHRVPIFSTLSEEELIKIASIVIHKEYKKGETILREGEKSESVVIINGGNAKAYKYTKEGREQILYVFTEGDFFGEQNLFRNQVVGYSVEALELVKTCMITKQRFQQLVQEHSDIAIKIIDELGGRMSRLESALQSMGVRNLDARVSSLLLDFGDKYGRKTEDGILIQLPLSREGIANYLGVARETVSRKLGQLEIDGVIRSIGNKEILILENEQLMLMAGEEVEI